MNNLTLGVDIGTTTVSAVILDMVSKEQVKAFTFANDSRIENSEPYRKEQDAERIFSIVKDFIEKTTEEYPNIKSIGFTGQMHGILYVDKDGNAVSPLYTWQDERGNLKLESGKTSCEEIFEKTGYTVSTGFGLTTHYFNTVNNLVPENAVSFVSIMDYIPLKLTGNTSFITHASDAASFGIYNLKENAFDVDAVKKLGMDNVALPEVTAENKIIGYYKEIPVAVAIGDNQASFFGAVKDEEKSVLVNYGTGSQISLVCNYEDAVDSLELRPYIGGKYLMCGSALCGGRAYAILEKFFRSYTLACGGEDKSQYDVMNELAAAEYEKECELKIDTAFCGTRKNPDKRGGIENLGENNFTPGQMILGVLHGMTDELYNMYKSVELKDGILVASGNGVQKNTVFQKILSDTYKMPLMLPCHKEEAAFGAALFAAEACGFSGAKDCIKFN